MGKARKHGHYCRVCGLCKSNESFSGKGHAAHICKACSRLAAADKAEGMTLNRLINLRWRLSDEGKSWLEDRMRDERPAVQSLARQQFAARYPHMNRPALEHDSVTIVGAYVPFDDAYYDMMALEVPWPVTQCPDIFFQEESDVW